MQYLPRTVVVFGYNWFLIQCPSDRCGDEYEENGDDVYFDAFVRPCTAGLVWLNGRVHRQ